MPSFLEPAALIARTLIVFIALPIHEFAHAWTADKFGDTTPRDNGRLTLDPLAHLDVMGALLIYVAGFGWAKPVPVNPYALRRRSRAGLMWVSLAGPMSNLALASLAAIPFRTSLATSEAFYQNIGFLPSPASTLYQFIAVNLALMLFNLIPLAPLDGEKIADFFFPPAWADFLDRIRPYGPVILLTVFMIGPYLGLDLISIILGPPMRTLLNLLVG